MDVFSYIVQQRVYEAQNINRCEIGGLIETLAGDTNEGVNVESMSDFTFNVARSAVQTIDWATFLSPAN